MGSWKKVGERTTAKSFLEGALTFGALGGGKTYTFKNTETGEYKTITASGYLEDGYTLTDEELGRKIANGEWDEH
ncbi:MAG: hypothetical protein R3330_18275 [Saprospiraceae bacterium]|nr:hypothetical protein [Saprospiraceae bacterium]